MNDNDYMIALLIETANQLRDDEYVVESPKILRLLGRMAATGTVAAGAGLVAKDSYKRGNKKEAAKMAALGAIGVGAINSAFNKLEKRYRNAEDAIDRNAYKLINGKENEIIKHLKEIIREDERLLENPNLTKTQWQQVARELKAAKTELVRLERLEKKKRESRK